MLYLHIKKIKMDILVGLLKNRYKSFKKAPIKVSIFLFTLIGAFYNIVKLFFQNDIFFTICLMSII